MLSRAARRNAAKQHARRFAEALRHHEAGRLREAERICQQILAIDPHHIGALHVAGITAVQVGLDEVAVNLLGRAVALDDTIPDLHEGIAFALQRLGRLDEALTHYRRTLALNPKSIEALYNCGNALFQLRRYEAALNLYDRVLALKPDFIEALHNRGNAWLELGRHDRALADYDRALAVRQQFPQALANRAAALIGLQRLGDALESCEQALAIDPANTTVLANRGTAHFEMRHFAEAARDFERLLAIDPHYVYAPGKLLYCKLLDCDWSDYDGAIAALTSAVAAGERAALPFMFFNMVDDAAAQRRCAATYCRDKHPPAPDPLWRGERYEHARIRVAYLSADFRQHPMALLMAGVFEAHDRSRFETIAVSFGPDAKDEMRRRLEGVFDRFLDVQAASDRDVASSLKELEIDIAVDLMGYTNNGRPGILALRPAPVQVNFLGYAGTMAAEHIDYLIADRFLIPEDRRDCYSESIVYLPDTYLPTDGSRALPAPPPRAAAGLPERGFVFCCFNNNYKIVPPVFEVWMRLLAAVDDSVLWLVEDSAAAARNLRAAAAKHGIAAERLVFAPRVGLDEYQARLQLADLFLDTLPYNAHTTAADALWAGLPVLTCAGDSFAARVAGSVLTAVGLPELITTSLDEYAALALDLARDRDRLARLRSRLAHNRTSLPLFDTPRFCRHLESAYHTMWQRHQRGEAPEGFAVAVAVPV